MAKQRIVINDSQNKHKWISTGKKDKKHYALQFMLLKIKINKCLQKKNKKHNASRNKHK